MENVNDCKYCYKEACFTEDDDAPVSYFIRPNGDLVSEHYDYCWNNGECVITCHVENHFSYCPFCGRKF